MPGVKLRSLTIRNFMMFRDEVTFQWVEDPHDFDEKTPDKIGFCGMNGTGKSTALSRALTWLIHPISNSLDLPNESDPKGCFNDIENGALQVTAIIEAKNKFWRARRWLFPTDFDGDFSLDELPKDGGNPIPRKGAWAHVFGEDGDSAHFLPYIWENNNLALAAASMGSEGGLRQFSENLGGNEMISDLSLLETRAEDARQTAANAHLDDEKLAEYQRLANEATQLKDDITELKKEMLEHKSTDNKFTKELAEAGGDFASVSRNISAEEAARRISRDAENAYKLAVKNQKSNRGLHTSACAAISDHIKSLYGEEKKDFPEEAAPVARKSAAESFKEELPEMFAELENHTDSDIQKIASEITRLADSDLSFDLSLLHESDSELSSDLTKNLIESHDHWARSKVRHNTAKQNLTVESGTISVTDYSQWKTARERIEVIKPEIKKKTEAYNKRKQFTTKIEDNDSAQDELTLQTSRIRAISCLMEAIESVVSGYEHNARESMINTASQYLKRLSTTAKFTLQFEDNKVMPYVGLDKRELSKTDQQGGPSAGQGRAIANMVMLARYEMINCTNPLILDDAFEKIDEHNVPILFEFVLSKVGEMDNQLIWVQNHLPYSRDEEFSLIFGLPLNHCEENGWTDIAPWNGNSLSPNSITFDEWRDRTEEISKSTVGAD